MERQHARAEAERAATLKAAAASAALDGRRDDFLKERLDRFARAKLLADFVGALSSFDRNSEGRMHAFLAWMEGRAKDLRRDALTITADELAELNFETSAED